MQRYRFPWWVLGIPAVALAACSPKPLVMPTPKPTANPETSYKLITPPGAPHYSLQPGQSASLPVPEIGHFAPPVYPPSLAHPGMPPVLVRAQLVFGKDGKVRDVVILSDSYTGSGHALFEDAVRTAAMAWVFKPLVFTESSGGGATPATLKHTAKPFSLWFEFSFRMVNGKPNMAVSRRQ